MWSSSRCRSFRQSELAGMFECHLGPGQSIATTNPNHFDQLLVRAINGLLP